MAVEKMVMMNVIGDISRVDDVLKDIALSSKVDLVSAMREIEENNMLININHENLERVIDLNDIKSFSKDTSYRQLIQKAEEINKAFNIDIGEASLDGVFLDKDHVRGKIDEIYEQVQHYNEKIKQVEDRLAEIDKFERSFTIPEGFSISIDDLRNLKYFEHKFGILSREDRIRLKRNYENILAAILHVGTNKDGEIYLIIYPQIVKDEMNRILRSVNFNEIVIPETYRGTITEIKGQLDNEKQGLLKEAEDYNKSLEELKEKYKDQFSIILNQLTIKEKIEEYKGYLARSNKFFYLSGWIAEKDRSQIENMLKKYDRLLITINDKTNVKPPTKLRNNWLFRPFEVLLKMYGVPAHDELDPTPFLSISYMLLFGAMFGDLGQGFIILLAGLLMSKRNKLFGGLLERLGFSSMVFGVLYGEVFGIEELIPALVIKPFEEINTVLVAAIIVGIVLILISYILGMVNSIKRRDIEEGLFGKEGLVGFIFYICLLALVGGKLVGKTIMPTGLGIVIILLCVVGMVLKEPLTNLITGKRPLHGDDVSGYYIQSVFSLIEVILSMLSGTISFIRVGAFTLTHVGLFIAFKTIGEMIGTSTGNIIVLIIGNIVVIGLEGLIVFIQGLRLQYYELFSRYYKGDGKEFKPISIK
ncbi:MAG: ATPase [Tissierellia bacterium]|nr:ATPase [Tissierellia bacterium]